MATFSESDPIVILSYARTPMGSMQGSLSDVTATDLGATAVKAAVERAGVGGEEIDRIYMGCVLPAGLGQAPARQAALKAGLPKSVQATTVNKVCGSGMQTMIMGSEALAAGSADYVVAGGMESMTNAPYLLKKHRSGARIGHDTAYDHMFLDGLEDAYEEGKAMGAFAQCTADEYQLTRQEMDEFAIESLNRASGAIQSGGFADEVVPVTIKTRKGDVVVTDDEYPRHGATLDAMSKLKPAFAKDGTVTAGNASGINDGAGAVVLMKASQAAKESRPVLARIVSWAHAGVDPSIMGTGPIPASRAALKKADWKIEDLDLIEANEAFAAQACAVNKDLGWDTEKVNVNGGAIAIGHPIGASGARVLTTLLYEMKRSNAKKGLATLCIGGGMGIAMCVER